MSTSTQRQDTRSSTSATTPRVAITTIGRFHSFDLAHQLHERGLLAGIYSGYPRFKLKNEKVPQELIHSFPYLVLLNFGAKRVKANTQWFEREVSWWAHETLDRYVARHLPACDTFIGLSGSGLHTGIAMQKKGGIFICDRGSTHIRYQDRILQEEHKLLGMSGPVVDPRSIKREEDEYRQADFITVPSHFNRDTFLEMGVPAEKLVQIAYGVDLTRFEPVGKPDPDRFDVLFVGGASIRKGVHYLLEAFQKVNHPKKKLMFVGGMHAAARTMIERAQAAGQNITYYGHCPQPKLKEIMSTHHVLVLPSIEEGLALVQAQAMACGCPVIATTNTGASTLFTDGEEGYIVPIRNPEAIADRLQYLADHPETRERFSVAALKRVRSVGGWSAYGEKWVNLITRRAQP